MQSSYVLGFEIEVLLKQGDLEYEMEKKGEKESDLRCC